MRPPGPEGGRDRRHFEVTEEGRGCLRRARENYLRLWDGLEAELEEAP